MKSTSSSKPSPVMSMLWKNWAVMVASSLYMVLKAFTNSASVTMSSSHEKKIDKYENTLLKIFKGTPDNFPLVIVLTPVQ